MVRIGFASPSSEEALYCWTADGAGYEDTDHFARACAGDEWPEKTAETLRLSAVTEQEFVGFLDRVNAQRMRTGIGVQPDADGGFFHPVRLYVDEEKAVFYAARNGRGYVGLYWSCPA